MKAKLNLNIDKDIIEDAKNYANSKKISLSKLIENYLIKLTTNSKKVTSVCPLVESLIGIIPSDIDEQKEYGDYIEQKYS